MVSANSRVVVFESFASDLVAGDFNHRQDLFYVRLDGPEGPTLALQLLASTSGPVAVLTWPNLIGQPYQAQFKNSLTDPVWLAVPGAPISNAATISLTDGSFTNALQRFYRLTVGQ
jgi:hypothetical protein